MTQRTHLIDRTVDAFLEPDGDLYGDERERLRWYEGTVAMASLQWILIPAVLAVGLWIQGREVAWLVGGVTVCLLVPMNLVSFYVQRHRVRVLPRRWTARRIGYTVLVLIPYVALAIGFLRLEQRSVADWFGSGLGAVVGAGVAIGAVVLGRRRQERQADEADRLDAETHGLDG